MKAILAGCLLLGLFAGCTGGNDLAETTTTSPTADPSIQEAIFYAQSRDVALDKLPPDGLLLVPGNFTVLRATVYGNSTATCWELHGPAPPRTGEVFPNPFIDFIAPSGAKTSHEVSISSGCEPTAGGPLRGVQEIQLPLESGRWTVHHDWLGRDVRVTIVIRGMTAG
ncbi:MAG TPA: hypothetical protein VM286_10725 [Candidatus Thermoplasmatota archaeon]|nr:hypothetical protein [Candidatus Thermoplasmatota archaeon]